MRTDKLCAFLLNIFDGNFDFVDSNCLESLIISRRITRFKRADGWVRVPQGPLRGHGGKKFNGPERRGQTV
jgi:hypothetical protein